MTHNPNNKECELNKCIESSHKLPCLDCTCPPPKPYDWKHLAGCPLAEPTQEKHECEQGTFCVECGRDNREHEANYVDARTPEERERDKAIEASAIYTTTAQQPTSGWEEKKCPDYPHDHEDCVAIVQAREEGRREHNQECNFDHQEEMNYATERVRQATIALFEDWAKKNIKWDENGDFQMVYLVDLLAYADSLKKK